MSTATQIITALQQTGARLQRREITGKSHVEYWERKGETLILCCYPDSAKLFQAIADPLSTLHATPEYKGHGEHAARERNGFMPGIDSIDEMIEAGINSKPEAELEMKMKDLFSFCETHKFPALIIVGTRDAEGELEANGKAIGDTYDLSLIIGAVLQTLPI